MLLKQIFKVFFITVVVMTAAAFSQEKPGSSSSIPSDSVKIKLETRISIYQQQLQLNNESIMQLQKELDERKKLSERLMAAIQVSNEMLVEFVPAEEKKDE